MKPLAEGSQALAWANYNANERLRDGREITVRAINSRDKERLREHFASLSPESRYLRFFGVRKSLTEQELSRLAELDFAGSAGLVAIVGKEAGERIVGVAHYLDAGVSGHAEFACDVADNYREHGIATILLDHLARIARANGISTFDADVMGSNREMLKVFADSGFELRHRIDFGFVRVTMSTSENSKHLRAREKRSL
jgi:RimJ/RimL family protein N-acetyltransferase